MITIDNEFKALIPPLTAEEHAELERSLLADGCRDALVGWIGVGQTKYHPDKTADTCKHYQLDRIRQEKDT